MAVIANRRSVMTLFSGDTDINSHCTRIVLSEKSINYEVVDVPPDNPPEDLIDLNPYQAVPTLVDRELVLYGPQVIMEYLDERFPHPPLMPVDPVSRAQTRLMLYRIEKDLYSHVHIIVHGSDKAATKARKELKDNLTSIAPVFADKPYFLSDVYTIVDCILSAMLWRLPKLSVNLPKEAAPLLEYADRMFAREAFADSLTDAEREMRS